MAKLAQQPNILSCDEEAIADSIMFCNQPLANCSYCRVVLQQQDGVIDNAGLLTIGYCTAVKWVLWGQHVSLRQSTSSVR